MSSHQSRAAATVGDSREELSWSPALRGRGRDTVTPLTELTRQVQNVES